MNRQTALHILVIDRLADEVAKLLQLLKDSEYKVSHAEQFDLSQLNTSNPPDLIIMDIDGSAEHRDFFRNAKSHFATHNAPIIATTDSTDHRKRIEFIEMGVDDLIVKPYYPEEVVARVASIFQEFKNPVHISKSIDRGFVGNLGEMDLIDLIQTMELGKKSGIIHLSRGDKEGRVLIHKGKIVDAIVPDHTSIKRAFLHMLTWIDGTFYVVFQEVPTGEPLTDNNKMLFEEATRIIEQWRAVTGDLPSLHTVLVAVSDKASHAIGDEKKLMLEAFKDPHTILQAIDRSEFDDIEGLKIIKALLEMGLLIEKEISFDDDKDVPKVLPSPKLNGNRRFKNKYSHIFSIFQRSKKSGNYGAQNQVLESAQATEKAHFFTSHEKLVNKIRLTKAELLLIRQKLGS